MIRDLFGNDLTDAEGVDLRDRWRTPPGVVEAVRVLLDRRVLELDAAGESIASHGHQVITARDDAFRVPWGSRCAGWHDQLLDRSDAEAFPVAWLNPPFSKAGGGKAAWIDRALDQAATGIIVALYLPCYADDAVAALAGVTRTRIVMVGRVAHAPPPGLPDGHPDPTQHAIDILAPSSIRWPYPRLLAWDWRRRVWVGRHP